MSSNDNEGFLALNDFRATLQFNRFEILICFRISLAMYTLTPLHLSLEFFFFHYISFFSFPLSLRAHLPSNALLCRLFVLLYLMCTHVQRILLLFVSRSTLRAFFFRSFFHSHTHFTFTTHLLAKSTALMDATALTPKIQHLFNRENLALAIHICQRTTR